jgi:hypothetical protein
MSLMTRLVTLTRLAFFQGQNRISYVGAGLTTASALTLFFFWGAELFTGHASNPYTGIIFFLILPGVFMAGLMLMPLGVFLKWRKMKKAGTLPETYPPIEWTRAVARKALTFIAVATIVNGIILTTATAKGVHFADSNEFCGMACHKVMAPEYGAFLDSPHSRVGCAQCHIGPGADWFVKAKISGLRQVWAVTFGTYSRPIPSPVEHLRPARETCEQCHWPQKFLGDKLVIRTHYGTDEASTPSTTILLMHLGGQNSKGTQGIHGRHLDGGSRIAYSAADVKRSDIPKVIYKDDQGRNVDYVSEESKFTRAQLDKLPVRSMDCVDCHNRPTHAFELPENAIDKAITEGRFDRGLPFAKKTGLELIKKEYSDRATAATQIAAGFEAYYREKHPEVYAKLRASVTASAQALVKIYERNIYPEMKITWGVHPNQLGHEDNGGCFRCHDGSHKGPDGKLITADCEACHSVLAADEKDPKLLKDLGLSK